MTVTERMLDQIEFQGKTQAELCRYLGIKTSIIAGWKKENKIPPAWHLVGISEFLGVTTDWLLTGKGEVRSQKSDTDPRQLEGYQRTAAETCLNNLTMDQAALINCYEKLDATEKDDIWAMIKHKLSRKTGLDSNSLTSKNGLGDETKTA